MIKGNKENIEAFKFYLKYHKDIDKNLAKDLLEEFEDCFEIIKNV